MATGAGLLLLALCLRLTVILVDGDRLHSDPDAYVRLATMLADGQGYSTADGLRPTAFRPVLYPLLLAGPIALGLSPPVTVAAWNLIAGLLLLRAVTGLAQECGLNRSGVLLVGLLAAVDPLLLRYTTEPMTEVVCAALMAMAMRWLLRFVAADPEQRNTTAAVTAGLLLGLSALCRPVVLVTCVFLTATMLLAARRTNESGSAGLLPLLRRTVWLTIPALVAAATVSPWIIRNAIQFHALIPATTHGGYTLLLGNNSVFYERVVSGEQDAWDGESLAQWQQSLERAQEQQGVDRADERAVDQWLYRQAVAEIRRQPNQALRAIGLRWRRFWALTPTASAQSVPQVVRYAVGLWYAVLGLGILMSLLQLRGDRRILLLWMSVASFMAVHSVYWTNTRMRAPLTGVLIVLAVAGWMRMAERWRPAEQE